MERVVLLLLRMVSKFENYFGFVKGISLVIV